MATKPVPAAMDEESQNNLRSQMQPPGAPAGDGSDQPDPQESLDPEAAGEQPQADTEGPEDAGDPGEAGEGESQARPATPEEQKMFDTMGRQALELLTSDAGARMLYRLAQSIGPEKALAQVVSQTLEGIEQAAEGAGVQLPEKVKPAVAQPVVVAMSALLQKGGLVPDSSKTAQAVMALLAQPEAPDEDEDESAPGGAAPQPA